MVIGYFYSSQDLRDSEGRFEEIYPARPSLHVYHNLLISPKEIGQLDYILPSTLATEVSGLINHSTFLCLR